MVSPDVATYNLHPYAIIVLPIPLAILSSIAISIRIWIRCFMARSFGRDDVCLIIAHICFLAACGVFIGIGVTEYYEGLAPIVKLAELSILGISLYLLNQCFFKLSMAFFFLRIPNKRIHRWIIIISVTISIIFNLVLLGISIGQCGNIATIDLNHPHCLSWNIQGPLNYFCASLNAAVDWVFAILAIYVVQGLMMDTRSKISVYGIILLASAGSIVSIVRIPYIPGLRLDKSYYSQQNDIIAYTSLIESAIGIIVASMSVMRPLISKIRERAKIALSSDSRSRSSGRKSRQQAPERIDLPKGSGSGSGSGSVRLYQALPDPTPTVEEGETMNGIEMDYLSLKGRDVEKGMGTTMMYKEFRT
ncbi:hypothetical protein AUEXF2481DRAFT_32403 [Aureobasidium subglaciale EXF-2481]|uniref:Rhodopsin domain-containing protein n=1 Tax=Aureobasidium subglaciale (strain EXF-2481) TaxID=1043005 RepID=A0A074Y3C1_AURSE|nr:uncharacterized protein AUEXF2481DRAFT_32403 [Aureobasidium subglaciale EXF-2481]KEQ92200.1 hypothetical protein AUEXF2481DRAFT_32403 [Aureobasidium subglaciale EXF-2481]